MTKHVHGGNIYKYRECVDFSANCNPLGTPETVIQAGIESLKHVYQYPEVGYQPLKDAIADYEQVEPEQVICGNGAAELIFTLCRALNPSKALLPAPTFAEYQQALESVGCEIIHTILHEEDGFSINEQFLSKLTSDIDIVFICNPNNPTGILTDKELLLHILKKCSENNIFLVVDECFQDFIQQPECYTLKDMMKKYHNLFLLKAFTKRYAMAGIRLGYGLTGNYELIQQMERCEQPWNISSIAQACGVAALKEEVYVEKAREMIFREKQFLKKELEKMGLKVFDSSANYLFFKGPEELFDKCVEKGILIRDCSNYIGLCKGFYRIAVKTHEENNMLISVFTDVINEMTGE